MKQVFRYTVPVDGMAHKIELSGDPIHVGSRGEGEVEFWAEHDDRLVQLTRKFGVVGTGQPVPEQALCWGTTYDGRYPADLVWHLYEITE